MLQPFARDYLAGPAPYRLPEDLLFPARSTEYLPRCYLTRCAPNRDKSLLALARAQNCDAWRVLSYPTPSGPLRHDCARRSRDPPHNLAPWLTRTYPSAPLLLRSPRPAARGKRRSLRNASRTWPHKSDRGRLAPGSLPQQETGRFPSARSEPHASRISGTSQTRPKSEIWLRKLGRQLT